MKDCFPIKLSIGISCFVLFFLSMGCEVYPTTQKTTQRYQFPTKTIVDSVESSCLTGDDGQKIHKGNQLEEAMLEAFSEEIPISTQKKVGDSIHTILKKDLIFVKDERYMRANRILQRFKAYLAKQTLPYQIFVVKSDEINAYTIPGGNIYLTTGLFKQIQNDDELALVIGHEVGHNENEHTLRFLRREQIAKRFFSKENAALANSIFSVLTAPYNQIQELTADRAALYLVYASGYSPDKALLFFENLALLENKSQTNRFTISHPFVNERIDCIKAYLSAYKL